MKKTFLLLALIVSAICINNLTAQVLYTENFDNLTLGDLGTYVTGTTPGKGGWYTIGATNAQYTIITEPNRGKVLSMFTNNPQQDQYFNVEKRNLNTLIDQRATGNNVIKIEIDFYTGSKSSAKNAANPSDIAFLFDPPPNQTGTHRTLLNFHFTHNVGFFNVLGFDGNIMKSIASGGASFFLSFDTWYQLIFYLDYTNKKCYFEMPGTNIAGNGDFLTHTNPADFKLSKISLSMNVSNLTSTTKREQRYDNIKITALKAVPPHLLSADNFLSEKFNIYPNPATNVVNITNSDNMLVQQVAIYDIAGKEIKNQTYTNETNIQLNIENLSSGTYMLQLQTNEGTAVKKLVKK